MSTISSSTNLEADVAGFLTWTIDVAGLIKCLFYS